MRTTLELDDDVILAAKQIAQQRRSTVGKVVSHLLRKALEPQHTPAVRNGFPLFTPVPNAPKPSLELINRLRDES